MAVAPARSDTALLERLRRRDPSAWDELYRAYEGRLYGFAYRLTGSAHDAADLVQETFVRALPRLDRLPAERADVAAYLFATAKNLFLKQVERGRRVQPVDVVPEPDVPAPIDEDPERAALLRRQRQEVRVANGRLAPRQRIVLALRELEDKSYAEIGELVGLNENAVAQLISRARQSLREELRLAQVDESTLPPECRRMLPQLSAHLDGQLAGAKRDETLAHLAACERCQGALADMDEAKRRYRALVPPLVGVVALREKVDAALAASGYWDGAGTARVFAGRLSRRTVAVTTVATVAALGVLAGGLGVGLGRETPAPAAARAPAASPTPAPSTPAAVTQIGAPAAAEPAPEPEDPPATTAAAEPDAPPAEAPATVPVDESDGPPASEPAEEPAPAPADGGAAVEEPADTEPPAVSISSGPDRETSATQAELRFAADEPSTYACSLDGAAWSSCTSPVFYDGLALGSHAFSVRATDAAGNDGAAATWSWTVVPPPDTTPPTASISGGPARSTTATSATFRFAADEPASFACSLDGGAFTACASPQRYSGLGPGQHSFAVRATDGAGNTGPAASFGWTIEQPQPDLVIAQLTPTSVTVRNAGAGPAPASVVSVSGLGSFSVPALPADASATRSWSPCRYGPITAVADPGGAVAEANEGNNSVSITSACTGP